VAGGCVRGDAQRVGEDGGWCLADELVPCGQPARPGRNAQPAKDGDELTVAAMFAGELPGKQSRRGRVGRGGHVAAVAQVVPEQGGDGLGNVEPVGAEASPFPGRARGLPRQVSRHRVDSVVVQAVPGPRWCRGNDRFPYTAMASRGPDRTAAFRAVNWAKVPGVVDVTG